MCELQNFALDGVETSFHQETLQILKRKRKTKQGEEAAAAAAASSTENDQDYESPGSGNWGSCKAFAANVYKQMKSQYNYFFLQT